MLTAALLLPFASNAQTSWTVADGTTLHSKVPLDFYNCDGSGNRQAQMLYPASLLTEMSGSTIGTVKLYHQNTSSKTVTASTWYLRMGETTETDLSSGLSSETLTTVYSGNLVVEGGVMTFEFTTPYTYNGGNLIVEIQTSGASQNWYGSSNQGCYGVDNIGSTYSTMSTPNYTAFVPKITFYEQPSCFKVNDLAIDATQTTSSSLTLTWTDANNSGASYDIYTVTPTDTTLVGSSTTTTYTATGLDANTAYVFGVASNCGGDLAEMRIVSGRTACAAIATLPYTMGFEDADLQGTTNADRLPFCWTRINTLASGTYTYYPYAYNYGTPHDGSRHLYFSASSYGTYADTTGFIMPELDVTTYPMNGNRVTFWAKASSSSYPYTVLVGTMTDPTDRSTFTLVESVSVTATSYTKYAVSLATAAATDAYVAFIVPKVTSTMYIDDVTLEELPSCGDVTGLTVAGTTSSTATLRWNTVAGAMGYTVYNMADSSVLGTATDTTYTVEDLDANTVYTFGVQSNCSGGDGVMATASGRTACAAETMPWSQDFASSLSSDPCWRGASNITADSAFNGGALTLGTFNTWSHVTSPRCGLEGGHYYKNVYGTSVKHWMITPAIDLTTATSAQLSFDVALTDFNNATLPEENADTNTSQALMVIVSTDGGATWQRSNATVWQNVEGANYTYASLASTTYQTKVINLDQYLGQTINIAFYCQSLWAGGDNDLHLDNIAVTEVPDCPAPANIVVSNLTGHTATLTWEGDADGYTVYDMSDTSVYEYANDTTIELYALSGETAYTFGVTSNCGSDESEMVTISFTTPISCPVPTNLAAVLTPGDGTVATLNWNAGGEESEWQLCLNGDMTNLVSAYDSTYDMTNLTPEQAITAKVRAICGVGDTSAWSSEISFTPTNAYTVTVNDGTTTNSYVPVYGNWVDNITKSQFIIPAADLSAMAYGSVNKLTFYSSDANKNWGAATFEVYLAETSETSVSALADYTTMTQVYSGSLSIVNNVMEITLTTPYQYTGGNLMVGFLQTVSGTYSNCNWYGVTATGASMGGYGSSISQRNFLPKTTFDFTPGEEPSCLPVSGLAVSDIATDEATLSWTGDASSYNVYIVTATDTTFDQSVSGNTVTLTGLTPMTSYTYGVRSVCGGDESDIRVVTFSTACAAVTLPYTETFASTSATRNCWNLVSNNDANVGGGDGMGFVTVSGRETMRFSSYSSASDYNQYGFSPMLTVSDDATNLQVKVVYATYGSSDQLNFGYITATDTVWDPTTYTTTGNSDWQSQTFIVPTTATQLAVHYYGSFSYYAWIDSVEVVEMTPSFCYPVTNLAVDSVSATSVYLSWADTNNSGATYSVYAADGTVLATGLTATSYEVTGLTASTAYTFGVSADCSADNNSTVASIAATTDCVGGSCLITIAGTDAYGDGWDGAMITVSQNGATVGTFTVDAASNTATYSVCSGAPVTFSWTVSSSSYAYPDDISFTITDGGNATVYSLTDATNMTDGVFFTLADACPSCIMPVVTLDSVSTTTATISWTSTAASFNVYNGTTAVATGISANTYTFTGLTDGTAYTFGVVALCSADDTSAMATVNAQTEFDCSDITTLPYNYGFEGALGCWTTVNGSADGQPWSVYSGTTNTLPHSGNYVASSWSWQSTAMNADAWLISPKFVLPTVAAGDSLTFAWWEATNASYPDSYSVAVSTTTNDTASFVTVRPSTVAAGTWTMQSIDLTAYAGQSVYVAFHHVDYDANYIFIDDVSLYQGAYVAPDPDTLTVTFAVNDATMGTTVPAPGTYQYITGDTVTFSATPNAGYRFVGWEWTTSSSVDTLGSEYISAYFPANLFMTEGSMTLKALFEVGNPDSTTITYAVNDATKGTMVPAPGTYTIYVGNTIQAEAIANAGYELQAWVLDIYMDSSIYSSDTLPATDPDFANPLVFGSLPQSFADNNATITITAIFGDSSEPEAFTLITSVNDATMGTISPAPGTHVYYDGDVFSITATPNAGYHLESWVTEVSNMDTVLSTDTIPAFPGLFDSLDAEFYLGMTMSVTAIFAPGQQIDSLVVTTSVNNAEWGTITPAPGTHYYTVGDEVSFDVQPNDGYYLYSLQVSMSAFGETFDTVFTSYEDFVAEMDSVLVVEEDMLGATISIHANFQPNGVTPEEYTVTVNYNATMGNVLVNGQAADNGSSITVTEGSSVSFTANAYNNYEFVAWVDNGDTVGRETIYTINAIDATHSVTAVFREKVGIADVELDNVDIYSVDSRIYVRGAEGKQVYLFDVNGRLMSREANAAESVEFRVSNSGVYLVKVGNAAAKRVVVIR